MTGSVRATVGGDSGLPKETGRPAAPVPTLRLRRDDDGRRSRTGCERRYRAPLIDGLPVDYTGAPIDFLLEDAAGERQRWHGRPPTEEELRRVLGRHPGERRQTRVDHAWALVLIPILLIGVFLAANQAPVMRAISTSI